MSDKIISLLDFLPAQSHVLARLNYTCTINEPTRMALKEVPPLTSTPCEFVVETLKKEEDSLVKGASIELRLQGLVQII